MRRPGVTFEDEEGVDAGGPTLEFFCLAMHQIKKGDGHNTNLFEGDSGHFLPIQSTSYLDSGLLCVWESSSSFNSRWRLWIS